MATAIHFSGRGGSDFADAVDQIVAADSVGSLSRILRKKSLARLYRICGTGTFPDGPIAVTCKITSPSLAHA
jgi:hypothetical protein